MKRQSRALSFQLSAIAALALAASALAHSAQAVDWDPDNNPLTVGPNNEFMVGVYQIWTNSDMAGAAARGFNVVHSYSFRNQSGTQNPSYLTPNQFATQAASHGLSVMMQLGVLVPSEPDVPLPIPADIQALAVHDNIAMWSIVPEEISWYPPGPGNTQFAQLKQWADNIHANDPKQRPVTHYLASNYATVDISPYTPFIDAIGAGAYADHASKPRPWIRWRIEQEVNAIRNTGSREGVFPVAVLQMFASEGYPGETTMQANDGYHDAYLSLVSGAKSVMIFTGGRKNEIPGLYDRYGDFAQEINGPDRLGDVFLKGIDLGAFSKVKPTVISGPVKSEAFTTNFAWPPSGPTVQYDSISYRVMTHNERLYIAAVNSAEAAVTTSFPAVRSTGPIDVLFQNRQVTPGAEQFTDAFTALGANNYRLPADSSLIVAQDTFTGPDGVVSGWTPVNGNGSIVNSTGTTTVNRGAAATEYLRRSLNSSTLPLGAYVELQVKADVGTEFYLKLVDPQGDSAALVNWQEGTGDWQTLRAEFSGSWQSANSLWLGIRGGASYEVGQLGVYFAAASLGSWKHDGNGTWDDNANWLGDSLPNSDSTKAMFGGGITSMSTVYSDSDVTVASVEFDNANRYTIAGQGIVSLASSTGTAALDVGQGFHEFQVIVALEDNVEANLAAGTGLTFNNALHLNGHNLTVSGGGLLSINNRVYAEGGSILLAGGGSMGGGGIVGGDVVNLSGQLAPGNSPGVLHISGDYEQGNAGSMRLEIAGETAAAEYDQLVIDGMVTLAGELEIVTLAEFQPTVGSYFDIFKFHAIEGRFDALKLPALSAGLAWDQSELYTLGRISVVAVPEPATWSFVLLPLVAFGLRPTRRQY